MFDNNPLIFPRQLSELFSQTSFSNDKTNRKTPTTALWQLKSDKMNQKRKRDGITSGFDVSLIPFIQSAAVIIDYFMLRLAVVEHGKDYANAVDPQFAIGMFGKHQYHEFS
jgi:hypothetical protein